MNFKNIAEAFNYYKDKEISEIEKRAKEINNLVAKKVYKKEKSGKLITER